MTKLMTLTCLLGGLLVLSGCASVDCNGRSAPYDTAQARAPMHPAPGLTAPEQAGDYTIPGEHDKPVAAADVEEGACFVRPPQLVPEPSGDEDEDSDSGTDSPASGNASDTGD